MTSPASPSTGHPATPVVKLDELVEREFPRNRGIKERGTFLQKAGKLLFYWVALHASQPS